TFPQPTRTSARLRILQSKPQAFRTKNSVRGSFLNQGGEMTKRRVLVVGYPKSGNTWLTRLTAELLGAPVKGFWKEPHNDDVAIEGQGRLSDIEVFKGHHSYGAMRRDFSLADVVYVVRDVAISG